MIVRPNYGRFGGNTDISTRDFRIAGDTVAIAIIAENIYDPSELQMEHMRLPQALLILMVTAMQSVSGSSDPPRIRVLVLDVLDGKPQAGVDVGYLCDEIPHWSKNEMTDKTGIAEVPFLCKPGNKIELVAVPHDHKEGCGGGVAATLEQIQSSGVTSRPDSDGGMWCPTKISRRLTAVPGQVTLFVKKPTWWQSHVSG